MDAGSWWRRLRRVPAPVVDVGLAVALTVAVAMAITFGVEQGREPDALAYALAPTIGVLSLFRRRWPLAVLLASAAALILYNQPASRACSRRCRCRSPWSARGRPAGGAGPWRWSPGSGSPR